MFLTFIQRRAAGRDLLFHPLPLSLPSGLLLGELAAKLLEFGNLLPPLLECLVVRSVGRGRFGFHIELFPLKLFAGSRQCRFLFREATE